MRRSRHTWNNKSRRKLRKVKLPPSSKKGSSEYTIRVNELNRTMAAEGFGTVELRVNGFIIPEDTSRHSLVKIQEGIHHGLMNHDRIKESYFGTRLIAQLELKSVKHIAGAFFTRINIEHSSDVDNRYLIFNCELTL